MKSTGVVFLLLVTALLLISSQAEAKRKTKKYHKEPKIVVEDEREEAGRVVTGDAALKYQVEETGQQREETVQQGEETDSDVLEAMDPCDGKCRSGEVCQFTEGVAVCVCIPSCPQETDPRRKVCSNLNSTWNSDCELHQMRCYCRSGAEDCQPTEDREKLSHMHIDYYGSCRQPQECTEGQMADFPRRMRDWLFNVMRDTADRDELSPHYLKMEREAETDLTKRWTLAAVWKFCELDQSHDRTINRHEIFPIRAPLMALEHCIAPFLDKCDADSNHRITLKEWASCLQINESEIEDRCEEVRQENEEE